MLIYGMGVIYFITVALLVELVGIVIFAIVFGLLFLDEWWTRSRRRLPVYGSGHAHAFEFADDEALQALQLSLGFAQRPGDVLKELFSTKAPPEYAVKPYRPKFWKVFWTNFKKTAVYRLLKDLFSGLKAFLSGAPSPMRSTAQLPPPDEGHHITTHAGMVVLEIFEDGVQPGFRLRQG